MGERARQRILALHYLPLAAVLSAVSAGSLTFAQATLRPTDLFVPAELGHITDIQELPPTVTADKLLIIIQDAHVNYEAQKHLAAILDRLASTYGIHLILVEGGAGDVNLSRLRARGSKAARQEVAERYLQEGLISGEEYLDLVSDYPLVLWGVDEPALYDQAMRVFLEIEEARESLTQQLAQLRAMVESCKANTFTEALRTFEAQQALFDARQLSMSAYLAYLREVAERVEVELSGYPALQQLAIVAQLEASMDLAQVETEQRQLAQELRRHLAAEELQGLTAAAQQSKAGNADVLPFYRVLEELRQRAQLPSAPYAHLADYTRYLTLKADLSPKTIWDELAALQAQVKPRLFGSPAEAQLASMSEQIARDERLLNLEWSPDDYQAYRAQPEEALVSHWLPALQAQAARLGLSWDWSGDAAKLDEQLAQAARFYEAATSRERAIVERALAKMEAEQQHTAVLIVGGFHTDHLTQLLADNHAHTAIITPAVGPETDDRRYATLLKAKYQDRTLR